MQSSDAVISLVLAWILAPIVFAVVVKRYL